jgi:phosphoribosylanthranilate isomerase
MALPRRRVRVKVCGLTRPEDAAVVEALGADAIGVIFAPGSRRRVDRVQAAEVLAHVGPFVTRVGVFATPSVDEVVATLAAVPLQVVQVHGALPDGLARELAGRVPLITAHAFEPDLDVDALARSPASAVLIDGPAAGSGIAFDWDAARALRRLPRWILAGGLRPENVADAVRRLQPPAIDVASGVESAPGIKDPVRLQAVFSALAAVG